MSLLDVLRGVMLDPAEQAAYNQNPTAYLQQYGYDDVDPADLSEAFGLVADTLPPDQAQAGLSATATPEGATFGVDTTDFDGVADTDAGVPGGDVPGGDDAADTADLGATLSGDEPAAEGDSLSFGHGEDGGFGPVADDLGPGGEPADGFDAATADDGGPPGPGGEPGDAGSLASGADDTVDAGDAGDIGPGGVGDNGLDGNGFGDNGLGSQLDDALDDGEPADGELPADLDDADGADAGAPVDGDPSDLDIGLF